MLFIKQADDKVSSFYCIQLGRMEPFKEVIILFDDASFKIS